MSLKSPIGLAVAAIAVVAVIALILVLRGGQTPTNKPLTQADRSQLLRQATAALTRTRGDTSQMTPDERRAYDDALKRGLITNPYMSMPRGGAMTPGAGPMSPGGGTPNYIPGYGAPAPYMRGGGQTQGGGAMPPGGGM